jgi:hypothetical protein
MIGEKTLAGSLGAVVHHSQDFSPLQVLIGALGWVFEAEGLRLFVIGEQLGIAGPGHNRPT